VPHARVADPTLTQRAQVTRKCLETHVLNLKSQSGDEAVFQTMHVAKPQTVERCPACNRSRCSRACVSRTTRTILPDAAPFSVSIRVVFNACLRDGACAAVRHEFLSTSLGASRQARSEKQAAASARPAKRRSWPSSCATGNTSRVRHVCCMPRAMCHVGPRCCSAVYRRQPLPLDTCRVACCIVHRMFDAHVVCCIARAVLVKHAACDAAHGNAP
jgi:hypothetical protein